MSQRQDYRWEVRRAQVSSDRFALGGCASVRVSQLARCRVHYSRDGQARQGLQRNLAQHSPLYLSGFKRYDEQIMCLTCHRHSDVHIARPIAEAQSIRSISSRSPRTTHAHTDRPLRSLHHPDHGPRRIQVCERPVQDPGGRLGLLQAYSCSSGQDPQPPPDRASLWEAQGQSMRHHRRRVAQGHGVRGSSFLAAGGGSLRVADGRRQCYSRMKVSLQYVASDRTLIRCRREAPIPARFRRDESTGPEGDRRGQVPRRQSAFILHLSLQTRDELGSDRLQRCRATRQTTTRSHSSVSGPCRRRGGWTCSGLTCVYPLASDWVRGLSARHRRAWRPSTTCTTRPRRRS